MYAYLDFTDGTFRAATCTSTVVRIGERSGTWREDSKRKIIKAGLFSKAEDDLLLESVRVYAKEHQLSQDDLSWASSQLPQAKKAAALRYKHPVIAEVRTT